MFILVIIIFLILLGLVIYEQTRPTGIWQMTYEGPCDATDCRKAGRRWVTYRCSTGRCQHPEGYLTGGSYRVQEWCRVACKSSVWTDAEGRRILHHLKAPHRQPGVRRHGRLLRQPIYCRSWNSTGDNACLVNQVKGYHLVSGSCHHLGGVYRCQPGTVLMPKVSDFEPTPRPEWVINLHGPYLTALSARAEVAYVNNREEYVPITNLNRGELRKTCFNPLTGDIQTEGDLGFTGIEARCMTWDRQITTGCSPPDISLDLEAPDPEVLKYISENITTDMLLKINGRPMALQTCRSLTRNAGIQGLFSIRFEDYFLTLFSWPKGGRGRVMAININTIMDRKEWFQVASCSPELIRFSSELIFQPAANISLEQLRQQRYLEARLLAVFDVGRVGYLDTQFHWREFNQATDNPKGPFFRIEPVASGPSGATRLFRISLHGRSITLPTLSEERITLDEVSFHPVLSVNRLMPYRHRGTCNLRKFQNRGLDPHIYPRGY